MKVLPILAALLLTPMIAVAQDVTTITNDGDKIIITPPPKMSLTPAGKMQSDMAAANISFIWVTDGTELRVAVFGETDPKTICEMADNYEGLTLTSARNQNTIAYCAKPE